MSDINDDDSEDESPSSPAIDSSAVTPAPVSPATAQSPMNPTLTAYLQNLSDGKDEMAEAQAKANTDRLISGIGRAGAQFSHAVSGDQKALDTSAYDSFDKESEAPVQEVLAKQKAQQGAIGAAASQAQAAATIESNDPTSPQSKAVQDQIARLYPGKFSVDQLRNIPASMASLILKPLELDQKVKAAASDRSDKVDQKATDKQNTAYNSATSLAEQMRGSPAVSQAEKDIYASQKVNTMFSKYGDLNQLSPQMANLATAEVAKIASNAAADDHMMQMLSPNAFRGSLANAWQKVTNEPSPANAGDFLQQYKDYADGITQDAHKVITDRYGRLYATRKDQWSPSQQQTFQDAYLNRFNDAASAVGSQQHQQQQKRQISDQEISDYSKKHGMTPDAAKSWLGSQGYGVN